MLKVFLGLLLGFISLIGLLVTSAALYAVTHLALRKNSSPIYIIASSNLAVDMIHLLLSLFYLAPSIVMNSYLFGEDKSAFVVRFLSDTFLFCWYFLTVSHIFMAINRFVVVCFPQYNIFTHKAVTTFVALLYPAALAIMVTTQHLSPCCSFSFDHKVLSYSYIENDEPYNVSNFSIDLPLNSMSSLVSCVCYVSLIVYVRRSTSKVLLTENARQRRNMREYMYAVQFCVISIFYLFSWILFRVMPVLVSSFDLSLEWFIWVSVCVAVDTSSNGIVYLFVNSEVKKVLWQKMTPSVKRMPFFISYAKKTVPLQKSNPSIHSMGSIRIGLITSLSAVTTLSCLLVTALMAMDMRTFFRESLDEINQFDNYAEMAWDNMVEVNYKKKSSFVFRTKRDSKCNCANTPSNCPSGPRGLPGAPGEHGNDGKPGEPGTDGTPACQAACSLQHPVIEGCVQCPAGPPGPAGTDGQQGPAGPDGATGPSGPCGRQGLNGSRGDPGAAGPKGEQGMPGPTGSPGLSVKRCKGPALQGPPGPSGAPGNDGLPGEDGVPGLPGPEGNMGIEGNDGEEGKDGLTGERGLPGPPGDDAAYCSCPDRTPNMS